MGHHHHHHHHSGSGGSSGGDVALGLICCLLDPTVPLLGRIAALFILIGFLIGAALLYGGSTHASCSGYNCHSDDHTDDYHSDDDFYYVSAVRGSAQQQSSHAAYINTSAFLCIGLIFTLFVANVRRGTVGDLWLALFFALSYYVCALSAYIQLGDIITFKDNKFHLSGQLIAYAALLLAWIVVAVLYRMRNATRAVFGANKATLFYSGGAALMVIGIGTMGYSVTHHIRESVETPLMFVSGAIMILLLATTGMFLRCWEAFLVLSFAAGYQGFFLISSAVLRNINPNCEERTQLTAGAALSTVATLLFVIASRYVDFTDLTDLESPSLKSLNTGSQWSGGSSSAGARKLGTSVSSFVVAVAVVLLLVDTARHHPSAQDSNTWRWIYGLGVLDALAPLVVVVCGLFDAFLPYSVDSVDLQQRTMLVVGSLLYFSTASVYNLAHFRQRFANDESSSSPLYRAGFVLAYLGMFALTLSLYCPRPQTRLLNLMSPALRRSVIVLVLLTIVSVVLIAVSGSVAAEFKPVAGMIATVSGLLAVAALGQRLDLFYVTPIVASIVVFLVVSVTDQAIAGSDDSASKWQAAIGGLSGAVLLLASMLLSVRLDVLAGDLVSNAQSLLGDSTL